MKSDKKNIILLGYSGHGIVVAEAIRMMGVNLIGYGDKIRVAKNPYQLSYLGYENDDSFDSFWGSENFFALGVGNNVLRHKLAALIFNKGKQLFTVTHPESRISELVDIGQGTFVARSATVNPLVRIGKYCIINTSSSIDHECVIGDGVHVGPGATLAGNVKVRANSFIGANTTIKEGITIGENVIIGAGSVIIRNVSDNIKVVGNPARQIVEKR